MQFVVLSSSRGTTFQAILDAIADGSLMAKLLGLVADRLDRGCVEKAKCAGIPVAIVERQSGESADHYDGRLHTVITGLGDVDVIAAIGWMYILTPEFIRKWRGRILNVHPALLPKYGGKGMFGRRVHEAVVQAGEEESGMTLHIMDEGVDTGTILHQARCPVLPGDTPDTLKERVQTLERAEYPKVLQQLEEGTLQLPRRAQ